jgi:antitoxin (DNA-binding transcriptional repressor) of toxin-antitoxin stability system
MAAPSPTGGGGRRTVNMLEAKTHLSRLVEAIETGAATEVVIARNGRPVARLVLDTHAFLWAISDEQRHRRFRGLRSAALSSCPLTSPTC